LFVVVLIQILVIIIPRIKIKFDFSLVFDSIKFGFPIIFSTIGYLIFSMSDIYMLNKLSTNSDVGMYSFGYKIANFINLVFIQSIGISYLPSLYEKEDKKNNKVFYSKMLLFYVIIISSIILLFIVTYRYILDFIIFNKEYSIGLIIVPIISLGFLIKGMNNFINVGIFLKNRTKFFIISSFVTAVFNISLNLFMIPKYGFIGAAFATLLSQILNTFMLSVFSYKIFKINFKWKKVLLIIFFISILLIINELTNNIVGFYTILIQVLLIISFFIFLYIIILSKDEQKQILSLIQKINSKR
jgi:O-antigen/teichoic acid export membrane protein